MSGLEGLLIAFLLVALAWSIGTLMWYQDNPQAPLPRWWCWLRRRR